MGLTVSWDPTQEVGRDGVCGGCEAPGTPWGISGGFQEVTHLKLQQVSLWDLLPQ